MTIHFPSFCSYPWSLQVVLIWHLADGSHCHEHLVRWPRWWAVRPAASGASVGGEDCEVARTVDTGHRRFTLVMFIRQFSTIMSARNQLGGGHHPIILCWILVDNFAPTRYRMKLIVGGSGQCSVQWQHSALLISATRPPRVATAGPEEAGVCGSHLLSALSAPLKLKVKLECRVNKQTESLLAFMGPFS